MQFGKSIATEQEDKVDEQNEFNDLQVMSISSAGDMSVPKRNQSSQLKEITNLADRLESDVQQLEGLAFKIASHTQSNVETQKQQQILQLRGKNKFQLEVRTKSGE